MKFKLMALAVLGAVVASAQAQITVFSNGPTGDNFTVAGATAQGQVLSSFMGPNNSQWAYRDVKGGATVGVNTNFARSGNGSVYMTSNSSAAQLNVSLLANPVSPAGNPNSNGVFAPLNTLSALSIDMFTSNASTAGLTPVIRFELFNPTGTAGVNSFLQLVFDPLANGLTFNQGSWNSFDIFANRTSYTLTATSGSGSAFQVGAQTLDWWMNNTPSNLFVYAMSAGVGSGMSPYFEGAIDNFGIGFGGANAVYNFEAVPEPGTLSVLALAAWLKRRRMAKKAQA